MQSFPPIAASPIVAYAQRGQGRHGDVIPTTRFARTVLPGLIVASTAFWVAAGAVCLHVVRVLG